MTSIKDLIGQQEQEEKKKPQEGQAQEGQTQEGMTQEEQERLDKLVNDELEKVTPSEKLNAPAMTNQQIQETTKRYDPVRDMLVQSGKEQLAGYDAMYNELRESMSREVGRNNARQENTEKASRFADLASAATALINLGGTIAGANPLKMDTGIQQRLQSDLAQAIDRRDKSLRDYSNTMSNIRQQRANQATQNALAIAKYDDQRKNTEIAERKAYIQEQIAQARQSLMYYQQLAVQAKTKNESLKWQAQAEKVEEEIKNLRKRGEQIDAQREYTDSRRKYTDQLREDLANGKGGTKGKDKTPSIFDEISGE